MSDDKKAESTSPGYIATLEKVIKGYRLLAGVCTQCGGKHAYPGAIYCGAGCTARSEAHGPLMFKDMEKGAG
jgi:uncharacterized OB-fold protein